MPRVGRLVGNQNVSRGRIHEQHWDGGRRSSCKKAGGHQERGHLHTRYLTEPQPYASARYPTARKRPQWAPGATTLDPYPVAALEGPEGNLTFTQVKWCRWSSHYSFALRATEGGFGWRRPAAAMAGICSPHYSLEKGRIDLAAPLR